MSEPMVFGIGSGIGFEYMERCDRRTGLREPLTLPDLRPGRLMRNISESLGLTLVLEETVSRDQARSNLFKRLDSKKPYGLKLDRFFLDYVETKAHNNAYFLTACGYDGDSLYVLDIGSRDIRKTSLRNIEHARSAKGFMASRNLGFYFVLGNEVDLKGALNRALSRTVSEMLYCPSTFSGIKGMQRFAERLCGWRKNPNFRYQLLNHFVRWESPEGGGGGYRRLYARFLEEAAAVLRNDSLRQIAASYSLLAESWSDLNCRLKDISLSESVAPTALLGVAKSIRRQAATEADAVRRIGLAVTS